MNRREALLTLNVNQNSSQEEIQTAYRKMALELHPDKNKEKTGVDEFKKITEAYNFLKNNEKDASSLMSTGLDLQTDDKYKEAIQCYNELIKINPAGADNINHFTEKYTEAMMYVDEVLEINPQSTNALDLKERLLDLAKSKTDEAMNISAANLQSQNALEKGMELFTDNKFEEAIPYLKKAKISPIQPLSIEVDVALGMCFRNMQKYDESITYFDKVLSIDPENTFALNFKGFTLGDLKRWDEVVTIKTKLLKINPSDDSAWNGKGAALFELSKYDEAIFCYDKALEIDPEDAMNWFNKGEAFDKLSKYSESIFCYEKGFEINPEDPDISDWSSCDGTAMQSLNSVKAKLSNDSSSETAEKIEVIEKSKSPKKPKRDYLKEMIDMAEGIMASGTIDSSSETAEKIEVIEKSEPEDAMNWFNKGEAFDKLSKYSESIFCYEKGFEINPDPDISDWQSGSRTAIQCLDLVKAKLLKESSSKTAEKIEVIEKSEPLDVLKMRLAEGEITLEEFNKIKEHLA